jgi:multiple sugar transport system substrate-binding protein
MRIIAVLAALFLALTRPAAAETDLTVYHAWPAHAGWETEIATRFMKLHPEVKIGFQAPAPNYNEGLISVIRQEMAGRPPDVFMVGSQFLGELVARKLVQPLDDLMQGKDMAALGYTPEVLAFTQVDGKQYGLPWTSSTPVMFYNADLIQKAGGDPQHPPQNWDETIALAKKIGALGDGVMGMYYSTGDDDWMTQNLLATAGLTPIGKDGTIAFTTRRGREALATFARFHTVGGQVPISDTDARQQMFAGKVGLYFNSTAAVRSFEREIGDRFRWGTAPMPVMVPGGGVAAGGMAAVILTSDPVKRRAAFEYLLYGTGPEAQALIVENTGYMPVNQGALPMLRGFYDQHPAFATSAGQIERAYPWFGWPGRNGPRISQIVLDGMSAIANRQESSDAAADAMTTQIKAELPGR